MTGTFISNEISNDWDSDIEDSNSSEEFLYAKGASQIGEYLRSTQNDDFPLNSQNHIDIGNDDHIDMNLSNQKEDSHKIGGEKSDMQDIWNSHEDIIAVTTNGMQFSLKKIILFQLIYLLFKVDDSADDVLDESSSSEIENEWVPSSWDSLAKPVRSAMKSPEKSSSVSKLITNNF